MDLSLSNSLVGGGSMNPDRLSLDLQFAADKTLTARRGPTPVFSRGSSGTFVNANGLIVGKTTGTTSSITPSTQAIGSQVTVIVPSGSVAGWVVGQPISLIVDTDGQDDPDATELWLLGNITGIAEGLLTFEVTSRTVQTGAATSWTLGYRGPRFDHDPVSRTNLLTRSQEFNLSPWGTNNAMTVTPDATIAPDGTLTADAINFDTNSTSRIIYLTGSAVVHTFSVWLRADTNRTCIIATAANLSANIDVVANVTTTWQRFSVVASNWSSSTSSFNVRIASNATGTSGTIFAWGAQVESGAFLTSYIPTTTAPVTIHDCKGLLIEETRENFIINSDLYSSATPTNITATTIAGTSVTGSNQIRELSLTSSGTLTGVQANLTGTGTGTKTLSVFIKKPPANAAPYFTIGFASSAVLYAGIQVTMTGSTPVVSVTSTAIGGFSVVSSAIETFPNGWYRISVVVNGVPASCFPTMHPSNADWDGISDIRQTLVAAGTNLIYVFGAQLEAGAFPTSYIPTTTTSVARAADVCSITGANFASFYNNAAGTLLSEAMIENLVGDNRGIAQIDSGTNDNVIRHQYSLSNGGFNTILRANGESPTILSATVGAVSTTQKRATAYVGTNFASVTNGGSVTTSTRTFPVGLSTFRIGSITAGTLVLNGHVSAIRYYRKRLPDAKLQTLTV
jgi:hypothetical protein